MPINWYCCFGSRVASNASVWGGLRGPPLFYALASSAPVLLVGGRRVVHPDADYGAQFSEGGLVQDTIQQASNRFERPAITSDLELGNAIWVNS
jgi:hypothetical protein